MTVRTLTLHAWRDANTGVVQVGHLRAAAERLRVGVRRDVHGAVGARAAGVVYLLQASLTADHRQRHRRVEVIAVTQARVCVRGALTRKVAPPVAAHAAPLVAAGPANQ